MSAVHSRRAAMRRALVDGQRLIGTFVKLASPDVLDMALAAGLDFVVVDMEHSVLQEADVIALVRHADAIGLSALVRVPEVDTGQVNRLLESGAVGFHLSNVHRSAQVQRLVRASRHAPRGNRSVSLTHRVAGFGQSSLEELLGAERNDPPILVGQIEGQASESLAFVLTDLDIAFVGPTDLAVSLELTDDPERLRTAIRGIEASARAARVGFGGWVSSVASAEDLALGAATYLVVGSDLQSLRAALFSAVQSGPDRRSDESTTQGAP